MPNIYEQVKQALQDIVAPNLAKIEGRIDGLTTEMRSEFKRLDEKIDSKHNEILSEIRRLDGRINSLDEKIDSKHSEILSEIRRLDGRINSLDEKIEINLEFRDRFAALESKVAALSAR